MLARLAILAALLVAGCGSDEPTETTSTPTPNPTTAPEPTAPADPGSAENAFIGSLAVDPGDGTLMIGTGLGLFRLEPGASKAERVVGELTTPDGAGAVSSNLVVRYAGAGDLLASGHPEGAGALPENLGLIRSGDAGNTWEAVSQLGESDFHILQVAGDRVVAVRVDETDILVSDDGGGLFEARTAPAMPVTSRSTPRTPPGWSSRPPRARSAPATAAARGGRATRSLPSSSPGAARSSAPIRVAPSSRATTAARPGRSAGTSG